VTRPPNLQQAYEATRQRFMTLLHRVRALPGVEAAAVLGGGLPLRGDLRTMDFAIPGRQLPRNTDIDFNQISPDYFNAIKVPLVAGRFFTDADGPESQPVVILNQAAAARYFGGEDALGRVVRLQGDRTIVGIVGNVRHDGPESAWRTQAFVPIAQSRMLGGTLVVRTTPTAHALLPAVRQAIWSEVGEAIPVKIDEGALDQYFDRLVARRRFNMLVLALFGGLGLVIAGVGIYGVMAYIVTQRTQEIGIRMALGALPSGILRSVLGRAAAYLAVGLAMGLTIAWALAALVQGFLFEIQPHDPAVYAAVLSILMMTGLAAAFLPARRAAGVDPVIALRQL